MEIFSTHGLPRTIVSDNGTNFTSTEFEQFMAQNGIKHIKRHPSILHQMGNLREQCERSEGFEKMEGGGS